MDRLDLGWMRVFRETAERRSFSAASTALGMSQPAVSYQIRRLEEQLGVAVLERRPRGVELTPAGRRLYDIVARSVDEVDALVRDLGRQTQRPVVRLRTDYAFSSFWLIPRMERFRRSHPEIDIQIVATQRFQPQEMEKGDVAVIFANADDMPRTTMLVPEEVVPVCSRETLDGFGGAVGDAAPLARAPLIGLDADASSPWFDWPGYLSAYGITRGAGGGDVSFNTYSLVLQAALENQGVALGWIGLVDTYLRLKFLVPAGPSLRSPGRGYVLLPPQSPSAATDAFTDWLTAEALAG